RAVVRERPLRREARLGAELVRPEADEHDEDERREQEEAEPEAPRQRPGGGDPAAAPLAFLRLAEGVLPPLLERLCLLELGDVELRCRLRSGGAGHPPPST